MSSTAAEDKWYADLAVLAAAQKKSDRARRRFTALAAFVVFAFLLLSIRSQHNSSSINTNTRRISDTQDLTCKSTLEVQRKFNQEQSALAEVERRNLILDPKLRADRIKIYLDARIDPLPICAPLR